MIEFQHFMTLAQSPDSEKRGQAAHLAALAYVEEQCTAEERAALYSVLMAFMEDSSVKVRAALAYGLLHSEHAPQDIITQLLDDAQVISRAVVQYSPVLQDMDLMNIVQDADDAMLKAVAERKDLSPALNDAILAQCNADIAYCLLVRTDVEFYAETLAIQAERWGHDAKLRGALLARKDLPALARLSLVEQVKLALEQNGLVSLYMRPNRTARVMRDATDSAFAHIGSAQNKKQRKDYIAALTDADQINTRRVIHAWIHGHCDLFTDCIAQLSKSPSAKVSSLIKSANKATLNALFEKAGFPKSLVPVLSVLVMQARGHDLGKDVFARGKAMVAAVAEIRAFNGGDLPATLRQVYGYLNEQNAALSRQATRESLEGRDGNEGIYSVA